MNWNSDSGPQAWFVVPTLSQLFFGKLSHYGLGVNRFLNQSLEAWLSCFSSLLQIVIVNSLCDLFVKYVVYWFFSICFSCRNLHLSYNPPRILNTNFFFGPKSLKGMFLLLAPLLVLLPLNLSLLLSVLLSLNLYLLLPLKLVVWFWTLLLQKGTLNCQKKERRYMN